MEIHPYTCSPGARLPPSLGCFRTLTLDSPESVDLTFVLPLLPTWIQPESAFLYQTCYSSPYRIAGVQALFRLITCYMSRNIGWPAATPHASSP